MRGTGVSRWLPIGILAFTSGACATYYDRIEEAHHAVDSARYSKAIEVLSDVMQTTPTDLPDRWSQDAPLAALERGILLQSIGEHARSSRDLSAAEMELEFLDLRTDTVGNIGKYIYSDSSQVYKAQPTERLTLNGLNMLNYLAHGNLQGASVEARRFTVMREYLATLDGPSAETAVAHAAFGSYLAGFVFERLGEVDRALRYYDEALAAGELGSLEGAILQLAPSGSYSGKNLERLQSRGRAEAGAGASSEALVVVGLGRVPHKLPERMPIGAAIGLASAWVTGRTDILERSVTKVVVYPALQPSRSLLTSARVTLDGVPLDLAPITDIGSEIRREYEGLKPKIIGAALTRLIARAVAGEGARAAGDRMHAGFGVLAALIAEGALVALDRPDTRSWTFLPERILAGRVRLAAGVHTLEVRLTGRATELRSLTFTVEPNGFAVIPITAPR